MKKLLFLSLILCFLSAFVACEEPEPTDENQTEQNPTCNGNNGNGEVEPPSDENDSTEVTPTEPYLCFAINETPF